MVIPNVWLTERLNCGAWIDLPLVNLCVQRCYHETLQSHVFATMKSIKALLSYIRTSACDTCDTICILPFSHFKLSGVNSHGGSKRVASVTFSQS